ncbi:MAG: hypothetical protein QHI38_13245 [Armatimonadota bacterium]|nr:hypothetical protein [Armatimonadota bacterium]
MAGKDLLAVLVAVLGAAVAISSEGAVASKSLAPRVGAVRSVAASSSQSDAAVTSGKPVLMAFLQRLTAKPEMIYATGEGAMPSAKEEPNRAKAYLQAKNFAKMQALANLAQEIKGTLISYRADGKAFIADAEIKQEIKAALDCVRVVSTRKRLEGNDVIVEVTVAAPKPSAPKLLPGGSSTGGQPQSAYPSWVTSASNNEAGIYPSESGNYTSLIVDAQGLGLRRTMCPKILRPDGSEVWGTVKVDPEFAVEHGICAYVKSYSEALANRRAGNRPLTVRAQSAVGLPTRVNVVVSYEDADLIVREDARCSFLKDFRVIFIVDR